MEDLKNIDVNKIRQFIIFQKDLPEEESNSNKSAVEFVYIFGEDMYPIRTEYSEDVATLLYNYLVVNNIIDPEEIKNVDYIALAEEQGLIERCNVEDEEKVAQYEQQYNEEIDNYEDVEDDKHIGKTLAKGAVITAAGIGALGAGYHIIKHFVDKSKQNQNQQNINYDTATFKEIMDSLADDSEKKMFSQDIYDVTEKLNNICSRDETAVYLTSKVEGNDTQYYFSMDEDKYTDSEGNEQYALLQFTPEEIMAAKVVLNNYTSEQMLEIFGLQDVNSQELFNSYQKFASKMLIYAMNGKASSGVSLLIDNQDNRQWFEQIENSIVEFNKEPSQDNADKVIRTFAYFYNHGINGVDNIDNDEATLNSVKNLAMHMVRGYYDANINEGYSKYRKVSSEPGEFDEKFRATSGSQVQKGETLKFYLDLSENSKCTLSEVEQNIEQNIEKLKELQEATRNYENVLKSKLAETLVDKKHSDLASELMLNGMSTDLESKIRSGSHAEKKALEEFKEGHDVLNAGPTMNQILNAINKELGPFDEIKDDILFNNRVRGKELLNAKSSSAGISKQEWDAKSHSEKVEYAKEHGKVIETKTTTKKEEVQEKDLTPSEKKEVEKQKEELKYKDPEIKVDDKSDVVKIKVNVSTYKGLGFADGVSWASKGNYKYSGTIKDPNTGEVVYENGSGILQNNYYDIAKYASAYEGKKLTPSTSDPSIKSNIEDCMAKRDVKGKGAEAEKAYTDGFISGVTTILNKAVKDGKVTRQEADRLYKEALAKYNNTTQPVKQEDTTQQDTQKEQDVKQQDVEQEVVNSKPVVEYNESDDPNLNTDTSNDQFLSKEELEKIEHFFNVGTNGGIDSFEETEKSTDTPVEEVSEQSDSYNLSSNEVVDNEEEIMNFYADLARSAVNDDSNEYDNTTYVKVR